MSKRIVINPGDIYEAIRALIPTLPPSEDVHDVYLTLTPMDGQLTITTFDTPRRILNLGRTEIATVIYTYKIEGTAQTND